MERLILVTGATGYIGGRLVAALEHAGHRVRCLARRPETLHGRVGAGTEVVQGDCLAPASLGPALAGVHTAYYLVHSMGATKDFAALDREAAREFGRAAREAGVRRIIYLGGLGEPSDDLSAHLKSRQETGDILRESGVPVVEFRASIVIGSGSLSFEMVRALVERLPVLICPKWVSVAAQPIAIEDLIAYLVAALDLAEGNAGIFPIGGPDVVSYGDIMREYARQRGLRRWLISVPVLTPRLSSLWLGLVTPLYARVGRKLIDSLRNPTIVRDESARRTFQIHPRSLREAIARAASLEDAEQAATRWSDALSAGGVQPAGWGGARLGTRIVDSRAVTVEAPACRGLRSGASHRRGSGLVLRQRPVAAARVPGSPGGRHRHASWPSGSRVAPSGRCPGLLAHRSLRAGPSPAPGCRDEAPRPGLAAVRSHPARPGAAPRSGRRPSSIRQVLPACSTGTLSIRCMRSSSAGC